MIDLRPACEAMIETLRGVREDQLDAPTPCDAYAVADLVGHVSSVARGFASLARKEADDAEGDVLDGSPLPPHWRAPVADRVADLGAAWVDPAAWEGSTDAGGGLELPNGLWGRIALTEMVVHGWDLATATGQTYDAPDETLHACLTHVRDFVPNAPVPELWGQPLELSPDAPLIERVVALTGRRP